MKPTVMNEQDIEGGIMPELFNYLLGLVKKGWTGKVTLHFHQGGLKKVSEEKEVKI